MKLRNSLSVYFLKVSLSKISLTEPCYCTCQAQLQTMLVPRVSRASPERDPGNEVGSKPSENFTFNILAQGFERHCKDILPCFFLPHSTLWFPSPPPPPSPYSSSLSSPASPKCTCLIYCYSNHHQNHHHATAWNTVSMPKIIMDFAEELTHGIFAGEFHVD